MADNLAENSNEFKYVAGEKEEVIVVLFYGVLDSKSAPALDKCAIELKEKPQAVILLSFRELTNLKPGAHPEFAKFQKTLRDANKKIALCGLKPEVKEVLVMNGLVRVPELFNNVSDAWRYLNAIQKGPKSI